jgi:hypothetical protein
MKVGIERIWISDAVSGSGAWRFHESQRRWQAINRLYQKSFVGLLPDTVVHECSAEEFEAGYDRFLGIDVILNFSTGMSSTVQEKVLLTNFETVTVEYMQDRHREVKGDWFHMKAQYYVVGYDRYHRSCLVDPSYLHEERKSGICYVCGRPFTLQDWIVLDWAQTQQDTALGNIQWSLRHNKRDGARANFKYTWFTQFPKRCVVASSMPITKTIPPDKDDF